MDNVIEEYKCPYCGFVFSTKGNRTVHIEKNRCPKYKKNDINPEVTTQSLVVDSSDTLNQVLSPSVNHTLYLITRDDLLQILIGESGFKKALTYIKNCALARLSGDCRLLERVYLSLPKPILMYGDADKTQFIYYDRDQNRIVETNSKIIAKHLAQNLQICYMKGSAYLMDENDELIIVKDNHPCLPRVEAHEMQIWNNHVIELIDENYQMAFLNLLNIPFESDV